MAPTVKLPIKTAAKQLFDSGYPRAPLIHYDYMLRREIQQTKPFISGMNLEDYINPINSLHWGPGIESYAEKRNKTMRAITALYAIGTHTVFTDCDMLTLINFGSDDPEMKFSGADIYRFAQQYRDELIGLLLDAAKITRTTDEVKSQIIGYTESERSAAR